MKKCLRINTALMLIAGLSACGRPSVTLAAQADSVTGILEIANGYGGKLMIVSHPQIVIPLRNIVRVDSFYADPSRPANPVRPPRYRQLLYWSSNAATDTVGSSPALIIDGRLGGWDVGRAELFNPNSPSVFLGDDITTIGILSPSAAIKKYGKHGRNGAIVMTTRKREYPEENAQLISDQDTFQAAVWNDKQTLPGIVDVQFTVDTTGYVDPSSFVVICRRTPGAFVEPEKKNILLKSAWKPARLRGQPAREIKSFGLRTPVDSTKTAGDGIASCQATNQWERP